MVIKLNSVGPAVVPADLEKLRELCGYEVPTDYVEFLKTANGGAFESYRYVAVLGGGIIAVDKLAGLGKDALFDAFVWFENMNLCEEDVSPGYIPVAITPGSDPFVISLVDDVQGVYFWDDQLFFKKSRRKTHAYFVAPTFNEFLKMLRSTHEEAEADMAAGDSSTKPVGLVKPKNVKVIRPKFKGKLDAKLDQACKHFPELFKSQKCGDPISAGKAGYELTASINDGWDDTATRLIEARVTKFNEDPAAVQCVESNPNALLLYAFLFGFVMGQFHKDKITDKEFVYAKNNIVEGLVRNQAMVPTSHK